MSSYAGGHDASKPQTNRQKNSFDEPKQKRRLRTASNETHIKTRLKYGHADTFILSKLFSNLLGLFNIAAHFSS